MGNCVSKCYLYLEIYYCNSLGFYWFQSSSSF